MPEDLKDLAVGLRLNTNNLEKLYEFLKKVQETVVETSKSASDGLNSVAEKMNAVSQIMQTEHESAQKYGETQFKNFQPGDEALSGPAPRPPSPPAMPGASSSPSPTAQTYQELHAEQYQAWEERAIFKGHPAPNPEGNDPFYDTVLAQMGEAYPGETAKHADLMRWQKKEPLVMPTVIKEPNQFYNNPGMFFPGYVGRQFTHEGTHWSESFFANPFRMNSFDLLDSNKSSIMRYVPHMQQKLKQFPNRMQELSGGTLFCSNSDCLAGKVVCHTDALIWIMQHGVDANFEESDYDNLFQQVKAKKTSGLRWEIAGILQEELPEKLGAPLGEYTLPPWAGNIADDLANWRGGQSISQYLNRDPGPEPTPLSDPRGDYFKQVTHRIQDRPGHWHEWTELEPTQQIRQTIRNPFTGERLQPQLFPWEIVDPNYGGSSAITQLRAAQLMMNMGQGYGTGIVKGIEPSSNLLENALKTTQALGMGGKLVDFPPMAIMQTSFDYVRRAMTKQFMQQYGDVKVEYGQGKRVPLREVKGRQDRLLPFLRMVDAETKIMERMNKLPFTSLSKKARTMLEEYGGLPPPELEDDEPIFFSEFTESGELRSRQLSSANTKRARASKALEMLGDIADVMSSGGMAGEYGALAKSFFGENFDIIDAPGFEENKQKQLKMYLTALSKMPGSVELRAGLMEVIKAFSGQQYPATASLFALQQNAPGALRYLPQIEMPGTLFPTNYGNLNLGTMRPIITQEGMSENPAIARLPDVFTNRNSRGEMASEEDWEYAGEGLEENTSEMFRSLFLRQGPYKGLTHGTRSIYPEIWGYTKDNIRKVLETTTNPETRKSLEHFLRVSEYKTIDLYSKHISSEVEAHIASEEFMQRAIELDTFGSPKFMLHKSPEETYMKTKEFVVGGIRDVDVEDEQFGISSLEKAGVEKSQKELTPGLLLSVAAQGGSKFARLYDKWLQMAEDLALNRGRLDEMETLLRINHDRFLDVEFGSVQVRDAVLKTEMLLQKFNDAKKIPSLPPGEK